MSPTTITQLLNLLKEIDRDHPKDFIDAVCTAREALPATTEQELESAYDTAVMTQARQLSVIEELREQVKQQAAVIEQMRDKFISIHEYWNRSHNEAAAVDACYHAINTAEEALVLHPCPEVLNKARAKEVEDCASQIVLELEGMASEHAMRQIYRTAGSRARRIEKGEA